VPSQQLVAAETASQTAVQEAFSASDFRNALGAFATGVTVITSRGEDHAYGMTANAFSSVSLDPPLVLVCVISGTTGAETIERNRNFAVNILGAHQEPISRYFSSRDRPQGAAAFEEIPHRTLATGCPILEGVAGYLDCRLAAAHEAGDHVIYIGEVLAIGHDGEVEPLLFHGGSYGKVAR
jgi:flavin reductase (DIM6/NTAB) family NADH-FMN oxidoreductase RutF